MRRKNQRFSIAPRVSAAVLFSTWLFVAVTPVVAGLNTFTSRPAFVSAAGGGLALANFEGLGGQSFQILNSSISATIPAGVTFSSTGGGPDDLFAAPAGFNGNPAIATDSLFANFFGTTLIASFSPGVTAVGANVIPFAFGNDTGTIVIATHDTTNLVSSYNITPPAGSSAFFGIIATGGTIIDQISYTPPGGFTAGIDDFVFGKAVPEPGSLILFASAAVGFLCRRPTKALRF